MKWATKVCTVRCVFITPFGTPVVPPVPERMTTSSMSTATSGLVVGCAAHQACSAGAPGASPSMQTQCRILGNRVRSSAMTAANCDWKNSTSQSKASRR